MPTTLLIVYRVLGTVLFALAAAAIVEKYRTVRGADVYKRQVLRGQKPLALCDRCPCFGSLHPPLAALTFAASSIICAFGLASAVPRSPYRHLELCGIALKIHRKIGPMTNAS